MSSTNEKQCLTWPTNSGARKLQVILPLGGGLGKKGRPSAMLSPQRSKKPLPTATVKKG